MKEGIKLFTFGNFFISFCSVALTVFCHLFIFDKLPSEELIGLVFFATLFSYNFHRKVGRLYQQNHISSEKEIWLKKNQSLITLLILTSFVFASYFFYQLPKSILVVLFPLGLISVFYILQINKLPSLRSVPFLKIFIIAFVWGGVTIFLPLLSSTPTNSFVLQYQIIAISISLFVFAETLPFDIRDAKEDKLNGLKTIPQKIGIRRTKVLCAISLILSFILFVFSSFLQDSDRTYLFAFGLSAVYAFIWIFLIKKQRSEFYYSLGVESTLCMPLIFYYLLQWMA